MLLDIALCRQQLKQFNLQPLFIEGLGWDRHVQRLDVTLDSKCFTLSALAHKRGMVAFLHEGKLPDHTTRRKIERQVAKNVHEHLLIFTDPQHTTQIWQWVKRELGKPLACREHTLRRDQPGDALIQKLQALAFSIEEEESLTIVDVTSRVRAGFDVERVTKRFYDRFKTEHAAFLSFIKGIPDEEPHRWYASVMLNRLMFVYFIQRKGFLDGDPDYLRNRLNRLRADHGKDKFYSFYRFFLLRLFHEGLGKKPPRNSELEKLLGKIPYLNGGIFDPHKIERDFTDIQIPDKAFEQVFDFFEDYDWTLDPHRTVKKPGDREEIDPNVLGYIFEKYINAIQPGEQKAKGAYYTKEDITGYISQNTVLPYLVETARAKCKVAFEGANSVWKLLQANPDRYIYPTIRHSVSWNYISTHPQKGEPLLKPLLLPPEIAAGIKDVAKRTEWNKPAPAEYALPTEIWREVVARRQRYEEIRKKLASGQITDINDCITYNLDIRQFAQDVIENSEPDLLTGVYAALKEITVLDPTCGSGAFLFAALNILNPLYEGCLNRMALFVEEWERTGSKAHPNYSKNFKAELKRLEAHHNEPYFILKSIIVNNLYGVDIMDEAVEICKLRLFLKLVAQVESADDIEPLPDIDFNIRAGNTLVGYATYDEVKRAVTSQLDFENAMTKIEDKAALLQSAFEMFRRQQTELGGEVTAADKRDLRKRLEALETDLNRYLATDYGVSVPSPLKSKGEGQGEGSAYAKWLHSHKPFHWFIEFYGILTEGGFDVIIGNPPWKEYSAVKKTYTVRGYATEPSGNLYVLCMERSVVMLSQKGFLSFIVQLPIVSSSRMDSARSFLNRNASFIAAITCDDRPGKLFDGLQHCRSTILILQRCVGSTQPRLWSSGYRRWATEVRDTLFPMTSFAEISDQQIKQGQFPKVASPLQTSAYAKLFSSGNRALGLAASSRATKEFVFYQESAQYWVKATVGIPYYAKNGRVGAPAHGRPLFFNEEARAKIAFAVLHSSLFYTFYIAYGDCFHVSDTLVTSFPVPPAALEDKVLKSLATKLMRDLDSNAERKTINTKDGDKISYAEFCVGESKPILDEIDTVLAGHYGLTAEELDFIINYDIKYRLGRDAGEEEK